MAVVSEINSETISELIFQITRNSPPKYLNDLPIKRTVFETYSNKICTIDRYGKRDGEKRRLFRYGKRSEEDEILDDDLEEVKRRLMRYGKRDSSIDEVSTLSNMRLSAWIGHLRCNCSYFLCVEYMLWPGICLLQTNVLT